MAADVQSPAPDAAAPDARPGARLRGARLGAGLDEPRAAAAMRIDLATLRALESDDYARLGAPIFVKGHLRNYARLLGLDPEALVEQYEQATRPAPPDLVGYRNEGESVEGASLRQHLPLLNWGIALAVTIGVALWAWNNPELIVPPVTVDEIPTATATATAAREPAVPAAAPAPALTSSGPTDLVAPEPAPVPESVEAPPPVRESSAPAATPDEVSSGGAPAVRADGRLRLRLQFSAESWVEVYDASGTPLIYELFDAGRSRSVSAQPPLRVFLGQAGAVTLSVDGRRVDALPFAKRDGTARFTVAAGGALQ